MINLKLFLELKLCFLITVLCSSHITSSVSDTFFINCGSPTNVTVNNRTFVSDNNLVQGISVGTTDSNSGDESALFQTARVFSDESSTYRFPIEKHGWFLIRLYFLPLVSASQDLTTARFSVSAQNFTLIREYKPSTTSVVKEYSLNIANDNLSLEFRRQAGSIAFINALEVFRLPEDLIPEDAKLIGTQKDLKLRSHAMETVSRVNMGNLSVSRDQDKLWRQWDSDSAYKAQFGTPVMNLEAVNFSAGGITDDIAPLYVYGTATRLNSDLDPNTNANLTWTFKIEPGFDYFVRFHFCNIIVDPFGFKRQIRFDIFVNSEKVRSVDMTEVLNGTFGAPFFVDAVMRKARSREGFLNLSIGLVMDVSSYPVSFINGFEILKLSNDKQSLDAFDAGFHDGSSRNKSSNTRIGLIAGLSATLCVALVFGVVVFWWCVRKRRRRNRQMQTVHSRGDDHQIKNNEKPVVCGRPVIDPSLPREKVNLIEWAMKLVKKGKLEDIIDPFLEGKVKLEEVKKYCEITEKCLSQNGIERPTMGDLLWNLEFMLQVQAKDEKAAMVDDQPEASIVGSTVQFSVNGVGDIAGVSMSKVFAQMVREETR
ncbi:unnamed protein product [Arabidopsis arenosa]|uniref:Malectin-like domain-containing protein n=1 Tax=Arabidopsis arenosa TaxID=38785 RepID=A0A8S2AFB8_ARAAE|nr:unnamed protein product [Arabidopsis arenosa]